MWYKEPMQRIEIPEYLERSILEVVTNALAHTKKCSLSFI